MEKIIQSETLADQAYRIIKQAITNGDLQAGEPLPEEKLAKNLGISRTPLRDALNRLAAEGLIIQQKGAPAIVASFTKENSLEYMELRSLLEVYNIEKITGKVSEEFFRQLYANLEKQSAAIQANNYNEFIEYDREFHLNLAASSHNSELRKVIHRMNTGVNRAFLILSSTVPKSAKEAYEEHVEIVKALEERDVLQARDKMIIHMDNVERRFLSYYEQKER
jgi:DNA-binding GntR family transcriptional regulator